MQNFQIHAYLITCLTNLHVGSGDNNYGVVDKQVQRDSISQVPIINASSLKGALREYFEKAVQLPKEQVAVLFGSDKNEQGKDAQFQQGALRIFEARLLSIPVRGTGTQPGSKTFYRATSGDLINDFNRTAAAFGKPGLQMAAQTTPGQKAWTEFGEFDRITNPQAGENAITIPQEQLNSEVLQHLPIIARNSLDNGQSVNLWYEEIVPRESRFYFFVAVPENLKEKQVDFENDFSRHLTAEGNAVQIGANATVGYGYCNISKIG